MFYSIIKLRTAIPIRDLEQIIDHQEAVSTEDGFRLRIPVRRRLEGFDLMDIVEERDPFHPHVYLLRDFDKGWADFQSKIVPDLYLVHNHDQSDTVVALTRYSRENRRCNRLYTQV